MSSDRQRRIATRIQHIVDAVECARQHVAAISKQDFESDRKTRSAVERELLIIAEAYVQISDMEARDDVSEGRRLENRFPQVPWHRIRGFGNILRHAYHKVDASTVWATVKESEDLSVLVEALLTAYPNMS